MHRLSCFLTFILMFFAPFAPMAQTTRTRDRDQEIPLPPELQIPLKKEQAEPSRFFSEFFNMLITLGAIVAFLFALSWAVRRMTSMRMMQGPESGDIRVLDRAIVSPRSTVYLLEIKGKGIAVAESNNGIVKLSEFSL